MGRSMGGLRPLLPAYTGGRDSFLQNQTCGGGKIIGGGKKTKQKKASGGTPSRRAGAVGPAEPRRVSWVRRWPLSEMFRRRPGLPEPPSPVPALSGPRGRAQPAGEISSKAGSSGGAAVRDGIGGGKWCTKDGWGTGFLPRALFA